MLSTEAVKSSQLSARTNCMGPEPGRNEAENVGVTVGKPVNGVDRSLETSDGVRLLRRAWVALTGSAAGDRFGSSPAPAAPAALRRRKRRRLSFASPSRMGGILVQIVTIPRLAFHYSAGTSLHHIM